MLWNKNKNDVVFALLSGLVLLLVSGTSLFLIFFIVQSSFPELSDFINLWPRLTGESWSPLTNPPTFGIMHAWVSTLIITTISLTLAVPLGILVAIFTVEYAPRRLSLIAIQCTEILAGIPAVVYGFVGFVTLLPAIETLFDLPAGETLLAAGIILAVMILPYIAAIASSSLNSVSIETRIAGLANGVPKFYVLRKVVLKQSLTGIFAGTTLGLAKALGETLAVMMLAGNAVAVPKSVLDRGQPLTSLIATELGEAGVGSPMYEALFSAGATLMVLVISINFVFWRLKGRLSYNG